MFTETAKAVLFQAVGGEIILPVRRPERGSTPPFEGLGLKDPQVLAGGLTPQFWLLALLYLRLRCLFRGELR